MGYFFEIKTEFRWRNYELLKWSNNKLYLLVKLNLGFSSYCKLLNINKYAVLKHNQNNVKP